jgi:ATP-dependent protease ClpP protease subunit
MSSKSNIKYNIQDHIYNIQEFNLDCKTNEIYLMGETSYAMSADPNEDNEPGVEYSMANRFIKNLNILTRISHKPILVHMKTIGGDWTEGMAIYDAIMMCPNYVTILNYASARSMSSLIFLAADKSVMLPHSTYMFHNGTFGVSGTVKQTMTEFEELEKSSEIMLDIYVERLKSKGRMKDWSKGRIKNWLIKQMNKKEDVWLDAKEAVDIGFADEIFSEPQSHKKLIEY